MHGHLVTEGLSGGMRLPLNLYILTNTGTHYYDFKIIHFPSFICVYNFPKAVGVYDFCPLCTKRSQIPIREEKGATPGILVSRLNNR